MKQEDHVFEIFTEICNRYDKDLQRFIYTLTRKDQYAMEEIYQNTMVEGLKGLKKLRQEEKIKSWLFSIAKSEARRYYHKYQTRANVEINGMEDRWNGIMPEDEFQDFTTIIANREMLKSLLKDLSDEEQQIYLLHYYYDLTLKEISAILQLNYNTLRSIHARSLEKLRNKARERKAFNE